MSTILQQQIRDNKTYGSWYPKQGWKLLKDKYETRARKLTAIRGFEADQVLEESDRIADCSTDLCNTSVWLTNLKIEKRKVKCIAK